MACYTPIKAYYDPEGNVKLGESQESNTLFLPCSKCIGCRNDLTKDWAVRCYHESQMHDYNCVLTLTFNEDNLNSEATLVKDDIVNFVKRLRAYISRSEELRIKNPHLYNKKISYLYCGEYGHKFNRLHYHIIIFGFDFPDKKYLKDSESGDELCTSKILDTLWPYGFSTIGKMSMASAMYCASYVTKYVSNAEKMSVYTNMETGEFRQPEFGQASRRPAIGLNWFKKYFTDLTAHNCVIITNQKYRIPRYYLKKMEQLFPNQYEKLKISRENKLDNTQPDWKDLKNKFTISYKRIQSHGILKSPDNNKRLKYLEQVLSR